jgi:transcriptional regulator GlxA family with amidase domain
MQRIGFIVLPGFQVMSCAVMALFVSAGRQMGEPIYGVDLLSEIGGAIRSSIGLSVARIPHGVR